MKKASGLLLSGLLLLNNGAVEGQFTYVTNNGGITINGYIGTNSGVAIPDFINGVPVTAIGDTAFQFSGLNSLTVSSNVTSLGAYAFAGSRIDSIYIKTEMRPLAALRQIQP